MPLSSARFARTSEKKRASDLLFSLYPHVQLVRQGDGWTAGIWVDGRLIEYTYSIPLAARAIAASGVDFRGTVGDNASRLARMRAAKATLEKAVLVMATAMDLETMKTWSPGKAARCLVKGAGNPNEDTLLGQVYRMARTGDPWARMVARKLCAFVVNTHIGPIHRAMDTGADYGGIKEIAAALAPFAPAIVKTGSRLLSTALLGDPGAIDKITNVVTAALGPNPTDKAIKAAKALAAANALREAGSPVATAHANAPGKPGPRVTTPARAPVKTNLPVWIRTNTVWR